jgi:hypothetical protein
MLQSDAPVIRDVHRAMMRRRCRIRACCDKPYERRCEIYAAAAQCPLLSPMSGMIRKEASFCGKH